MGSTEGRSSAYASQVPHRASLHVVHNRCAGGREVGLGFVLGASLSLSETVTNPPGLPEG